MRKFKIFIDIEAEERYLNSMARKGYLLKKYTIWGFYHFGQAPPQALNYRVDYRMFKSPAEHEEYKTFFADAGWRLVDGTYYTGNQYFLPVNDSDGELPDLFSDNKSRIARYRRVLRLVGVAFGLHVVSTLLWLYNHSHAGDLHMLSYGMLVFCVACLLLLGYWILGTLRMMRKHKDTQ